MLSSLWRFTRCLTLALPALAQVPHHYAIILEEAPVAERFASRAHMGSAPALTYRRQLQEHQQALRAVLAARRVAVTGAADTLLNAVFVTATPERAAELQGLPGVAGIVELRHARRYTNKATTLVNAPAAWTANGGVSNAGAGIKIGILDTGIDQNHPAFQDTSLTVPKGFPICSGFDGACSGFTNNKVIVARSYVKQLAAGSDPANPAADSRPDDYTPRDRDGHGTAVASIAAAVSNGTAVTFNGVAPKAFLGNYKVFGSPNVNDSPPESVFILADRGRTERRHGRGQRLQRFRGPLRRAGYRRRLRPARGHRLRSGGHGFRKRSQGRTGDRGRGRQQRLRRRYPAVV